MGRARVVVPASDDEAIPEVVEIPEAGDLDHLANADAAWRWVVYRKLRPEERGALGGAQRVMLQKIEGPVDIEQIRLAHGGGTFEFWGTLTGSDRLRVKHEVTVGGPLKPAIQIEPAPPVPSTNGTAPATDQLTRILERIEASNAAVLARLAVPAPQPQGMTLKDVVALLPLLRGNEPDPRVQVEGMLELVQTGIQLGTQREPAEPPDAATQLLEKAMPIIEKVATAMFTRRAAPRAPQPAASGTSTAEVVTEGPRPFADVMREQRLGTLVDAMARAIAQGVEVPDFADTVERILPDDELFLLKQYEADTLMAEIQKQTGDHYPTLQGDQAKAYIAALLNELRNPSVETEESET